MRSKGSVYVGGKMPGLVLAVGLLGMAAAVPAGAACMVGDTTAPQGGAAATTTGRFTPAMFSPDIEPSHEGNFERDSIVGLWEFTFDGFSVDFGTQAWHSDGTEIIFSAGQNPATGDVCQGVWRKVGHSTYTLNHLALAWTAPGAGYGLRIHIHATVKVDRSGNAYAGRYTTSVYSVSKDKPFDESILVASGGGNVHGQRVQPD